MRTRRILLALGVIVIFCIVAVVLFIGSSPYLRFMHKGIGYYSEVAHACDSVLQQHQVSSNDTVSLNSGMVSQINNCLTRLQTLNCQFPSGKKLPHHF